MNSSNSAQTYLQNYVRRTLSRSTISRRQCTLTIGVEHEFFLTDVDGRLSSLELSQAFLASLSRLNGWAVYSGPSAPSSDCLIERVSFEREGGLYTAVKYEHPPWFLEVAFSYHSNLHMLKDEINSVWECLLIAANQVGAKIKSVPHVSASSEFPADADKINPVYRQLSQSRRAHYLRRGEAVNEDAVNFPTCMASTQVHVGGTVWWNNSNLLRSLYCLEAKIQPFSYLVATNSRSEAAALIANRWGKYRSVFSDLELLGFPSLEDWTTQAWISALCRTPIFGPENDSLTNSTIDSLGMEFYDDKSAASVLTRLRDLQVIRPKLIGTLEFRADPAMKGPDEILAIAALRLGQCELVRKQLSTSHTPAEFVAARNQWWSNVDRLVAQRSLENAIREICTALSERTLNEECYLERYA